jgi:nitrate/nitrite-specific signal transduction histidine kinase
MLCRIASRDKKLPMTSQDELGQLTATFNQMCIELAKADSERKLDRWYHA